jgi:hypothetical protein
MRTSPPSPAAWYLPRLIGVPEARQTEGGEAIRNDRLVAVVETPYKPPKYRSLEEVNPQSLEEIEHFYVTGPTAPENSSSKRRV